MTKKQKLQLEQSEKRQKINDLLALDELTDEQRAELDTLTKRMQQIEPELRAAIVAEGDEEQRAAGLFANDGGDGESAEVRQLRGKARLGAFVEAALEQRAVAGVEAELNAALEIPAGRFPLELLAPEPEPEARTEHRATTDTDAAARQTTWLDRLFAETAAMRLGVSFQSVMPGVSAHPVTTAGASAAQRGRTEAAADTAWTVGVTEIKPSRNAVRAVFSEEDAARLPGLESALRRDLSMALAEGVDRAIFLGDDGATPNTADITGLNTATGVIEKTLTQAAKVKAPETLAEFAELVDGKHATSLGDLRVVASTGLNTLWLSTIANASADTKTVASFLMENGLMWGIRGDISETTAADEFGAYIGRGRGITGAGVAAIWRSGMLVRDVFTGAAKGEVALTVSHLWGFKLPRPSSFARLKFVA